MHRLRASSACLRSSRRRNRPRKACSRPCRSSVTAARTAPSNSNGPPRVQSSLRRVRRPGQNTTQRAGSRRLQRGPDGLPGLAGRHAPSAGETVHQAQSTPARRRGVDLAQCGQLGRLVVDLHAHVPLPQAACTLTGPVPWTIAFITSSVVRRTAISTCSSGNSRTDSASAERASETERGSAGNTQSADSMSCPSRVDYPGPYPRRATSTRALVDHRDVPGQSHEARCGASRQGDDDPWGVGVAWTDARTLEAGSGHTATPCSRTSSQAPPRFPPGGAVHSAGHDGVPARPTRVSAPPPSACLCFTRHEVPRCAVSVGTPSGRVGQNGLGVLER